MAHVGQAGHLDAVDDVVAAGQKLAPLGGRADAPAFAGEGDYLLGDLMGQLQPLGIDIDQRKAALVQPLNVQDIGDDLAGEHGAAGADKGDLGHCWLGLLFLLDSRHRTGGVGTTAS